MQESRKHQKSFNGNMGSVTTIKKLNKAKKNGECIKYFKLTEENLLNLKKNFKRNKN